MLKRFFKAVKESDLLKCALLSGIFGLVLSVAEEIGLRQGIVQGYTKALEDIVDNEGGYIYSENTEEMYFIKRV